MTKRRSTINPKVINLTLIALFIALIAILTFTPLGYLKTPMFEITLMVLPVAVGSVVLDWKSGALLGAAFGLTSFMTCFGIGMPSALGAILLQENAWFTAIVCIIPRILCGIFPALIYKMLLKIDKKGLISAAVACLSTALINTLLFLGGIWLFFANTINEHYGDFIVSTHGSFNIFTFFIAFASVNALIEAGVCLFAGTAIAKALLIVKNRLQ